MGTIESQSEPFFWHEFGSCNKTAFGRSDSIETPELEASVIINTVRW